MSAAFKIAKKKYSQNELRKLMSEHRSKNDQQKKTTKIDSPLAKYNEAGQLTCILCKSIVRSEDVWKVHINARQHKDNVTLAKKLKEQTQNFTQLPVKRLADPPLIEETVPEKKVKGILKHSTSTITSSMQNNTTKLNKQIDSQLPNDFFDAKSKPPVKQSISKTLGTHVEKEAPTKMDVDKDDLPEGFFDDPILDAKVRNLEYKDPVEEEWEKFQKEIKEADNLSSAIIAEEQEEATADRQIDEIDEQMRNWSRVLDLEKKKQEVILTEKYKIHSKMNTMSMNTVNNTKDDDDEDDDDEDLDIDEILDWRAKKLKR